MENENIKALFVIANAGYADDVIEIARGVGVRGATILNARGEGVRHELFMGITMDSEKEMIMSIVEAAVADKAMAAIKEKAGIHSPAHSVCFTMPVEKMIGIGAIASKE